MSSVTKQVLELLEGGDREVASAAALVLGRLRPVTEEVLDALSRGLDRASASEASYFIDAMAATDREEILEHLIPYVENPGSLAEQVCQVLRRFGPRSLPFIARRHEGIRGWRSGAYEKALAGIATVEACAMLFDRLPESSWDQARAMSVCLLETARDYDEAPRALAIERIRAGIAKAAGRGPTPELNADQKSAASQSDSASSSSSSDSDDAGSTESGEITYLRLLQAFPEAAEFEALLRISEPRSAPGLRRHALQIFEKLPLTEDERVRLHERLVPYLDESAVDAVIRPSLAALRAHPLESPPRERLRTLASSPHFLVAEFALYRLREVAGEEAHGDLIDALSSRHPRVRAVAIRGLATSPIGIDALLGLLEARPDSYAAKEIAEILGKVDQQQPIGSPDDQPRVAEDSRDAPSNALDQAALGRLMQLYTETCREGKVPPETWTRLLGARDREGLNAGLRREAEESADPELRIHLLQPLLKWRLGDEETRFCLALANFAAAKNRAMEDPRFRRGVDILAPLSRTRGYSLSERIAQSPISTSDLLVIAEAFCLKSATERQEAMTFLEAISESDLDDAEAERRRRLVARLGASS